MGIDGAGAEDQSAGTAAFKTEGNGNTTAASGGNPSKIDAKERGRRQWVRDLRRRLWWCVYSVDRLVSTCVGRPFVSNPILILPFPGLRHWRCWSKFGLDLASCRADR